MNSIDSCKDENQIAQNLIQNIKKESLINRDIASLNRIIEIYFNQKKHNKSEEKQVINFLFQYLDAHGRIASILFTHLSNSCEIENVIKRLHKNYKGIFDFNIINNNVVDLSYKLIKLFEIMKIFLCAFFLLLPISFAFYYQFKSHADIQFTHNYQNGSFKDIQFSQNYLNGSFQNNQSIHDFNIKTIQNGQITKNFYNESQVEKKLNPNQQLIESSFLHKNTSKNQYTILPLGILGSGKSSNGCAILRKRDAFVHIYSGLSVTRKTKCDFAEIDGNQFNYIDTTGFYDSQANDKANIDELVSFLKNWEYGINSVLITINVHSRFDINLQMMIKLINYFFNDPNIWKQAGIVFTHCYNGTYDKKEAETNYRQLIIDFIKKLPGCHDVEFELPCFFVDSDKFDTDEFTISEYQRIYQFTKKFKPFQTLNIRTINPKYMMKEVKRQVIKEEEEQHIENGKTKRIFKFKDQLIAEITDWNGKRFLKPPKTIKNWTEEQIEEEQFINNVLVKTVNHGYNGYSGYKIEYFEDHKRLKIINGNGEIIKDETSVVNSWEIKTEIVFNSRKCYDVKIGSEVTQAGRVIIDIATIGLAEILFNSKTKHCYNYYAHRESKRNIIINSKRVNGDWIIIKEYLL